VEKRRNYSSFLALKNRLLTPDAQDVENILKIVNCVMNPDAPAENAVFALLEVLLNQRGKQRNAPAPKEREDLFGRICNYIRENFDDEISVKTLASEFNVTTETIRRQFRKAGASLTPKKMLVLLRHQLAIELLEHSSMSVAEIARRCGFSDIFAFSRAFKRIDGNSPTQHRKLLKL
jgi:two-component system response regulator YesN